MEFADLSWSPDGKHLAFCAWYYDEGAVYEEMPIEQVLITVAVDNPTDIRVLTPSAIYKLVPDESCRYWALVSYWGLFILDLRDGTISHPFLAFKPGDRRDYITDAIWSNSGDEILFTVFEYGPVVSTPYRLNLSTNQTSRIFPVDSDAIPTRLKPLRWEKDSMVLFLAEESDHPGFTIRQVDIRTGKITPVSIEQVPKRLLPRLSVLAEGNGVLHIESCGARVRSLVPQSKGWLENAYLSPDSRFIVYTHRQDDERRTYLIRTDGTDNRLIECGEPYAWIGDGSGLLSYHQEFLKFTAINGKTSVICPINESAVNSIVPAPTGSWWAMELSLDKDRTVIALGNLDSSGYRLIGTGTAPQWLNSNHLLYHTPHGFATLTLQPFSHRTVKLLANGFYPTWHDDTTIRFFAGTSYYKWEQEKMTVHYPTTAACWFVNINTGRMWQAETTAVPVIPLRPDLTPASAPHQDLLAWFADLSSAGEPPRPAILIGNKSRTWQKVVVGPWTNY